MWCILSQTIPTRMFKSVTPNYSSAYGNHVNVWTILSRPIMQAVCSCKGVQTFKYAPKSILLHMKDTLLSVMIGCSDSYYHRFPTILLLFSPPCLRCTVLLQQHFQKVIDFWGLAHYNISTHNTNSACRKLAMA